MTGRQMGLESFSGKERGYSCVHLKRTFFTGIRDPQGDVVCMGSCEMKGGTVYSRDCEVCTLWAGRD